MAAHPDSSQPLLPRELPSSTLPQVSAVEAGLLAGMESFVVAAPAASGKTLVAELAALATFIESGGMTLYLVPLQALAREK